MLCVFIDDLLLVATSYEECCYTVMQTIQSLDRLGFTVHPEKSVFLPQKQITFLGFDINSTLIITFLGFNINDGAGPREWLKKNS